MHLAYLPLSCLRGSTCASQRVSSRTGTFILFTLSRYSFTHVQWALFRASIAERGVLVTAVALCPLLPVVSSAQGGLGSYNTEWEALCCPSSGEAAEGKQGESLAPPRAFSTCFLAVGEASALSRFLRGRKGWVQDFPSSCCQPSLPASLDPTAWPALLPASQLGVSHSSVCGMSWPWFGSASANFLADLGWILTTLPLIQTWIFCPASGPAGQTYFPARAQAG